MNRLIIRLILAMLLVALFTSAVIVLSQIIGAELHLRTLPPEIQAEMKRRREADKLIRERLENGEQVDLQLLSPPPPPISGDVVARINDVREYQRRAMWVGVGVAALLASVVAIFLARSISSPITRVTLASEKIADGDLSIRVEPRSAFSSLEAKALTNNFNKMATSLESYEKERRDMIASIAHDLRTPLTAMQVRLEVLQDGLIPLTQDEISLLLSQTELLSRLINDLKTLTSADAGKLSLKKQSVNIYDLLEENLAIYEDKAKLHNVHLKLQGDTSITAKVDPERIQQIIGNLLDNALRVSPAHGTVTLELSKENDSIEVKISDEGPGIPEKLLPRIFDRYVQDKDMGGSSGLGLAIVKTLVTLHGGKVEASNRSEGGALFKLYFPS